mgnify:CR=1 FL=1
MPHLMNGMLGVGQAQKCTADPEKKNNAGATGMMGNCVATFASATGPAFATSGPRFAGGASGGTNATDPSGASPPKGAAAGTAAAISAELPALGTSGATGRKAAAPGE